MAQRGQDIIMMTMLPAKLTTSNFNDYVNRYQSGKVNLHLMYYPPSTSKELVQLADLSTFGSFHFIPNGDPPIDDWLNGMTWSVGTLQTIFSRTFSHRPKVNVKDTAIQEFLGNGAVADIRAIDAKDHRERHSKIRILLPRQSSFEVALLSLLR